MFKKMNSYCYLGEDVIKFSINENTQIWKGLLRMRGGTWKSLVRSWPPYMTYYDCCWLFCLLIVSTQNSVSTETLFCTSFR